MTMTVTKVFRGGLGLPGLSSLSWGGGGHLKVQGR